MMSDSRCSTCGLYHQRGQCRQQTSTTDSSKDCDITPAYCCTSYFSIISFGFALFLSFLVIIKHDTKASCYVELFVNSVSVNANTNVSTADWRIGFVGRSPDTGCKISLHALNSRLLRGDKVISKSSSLSDNFGQVTGGITDVVFENVVMPEVTGDVIWDFRVEIVTGLNTDALDVYGFLIATCSDIPVKFTTDPSGKVKGLLLGNMRRCDSEYRHNLDTSA